MKLLDCHGKHYREVNTIVEVWWNSGERKIVLERVNGQRYIGRALSGSGYLEIRGIPCLLYTSDAADDLLCVAIGGRRSI